MRHVPPVNALRNAALLLARTPLVLALDADFLVSRGLADMLGDPPHRCEPLYTPFQSTEDYLFALGHQNPTGAGVRPPAIAL